MTGHFEKGAWVDTTHLCWEDHEPDITDQVAKCMAYLNARLDAIEKEVRALQGAEPEGLRARLTRMIHR